MPTWKSRTDDLAPIGQSFQTLPIPWVNAEDISNAVEVTLAVDAGSCLK